MPESHSNRKRGRQAREAPGPPAPAFIEMDPAEAAEYGAFRDDVDLEDVLEAADLPEAQPGEGGRGV